MLLGIEIISVQMAIKTAVFICFLVLTCSLLSCDGNIHEKVLATIKLDARYTAVIKCDRISDSINRGLTVGIYVDNNRVIDDGYIGSTAHADLNKLRFSILRSDDDSTVAIVESRAPHVVLALVDLGAQKCWPLVNKNDNWEMKHTYGIELLKRFSNRINGKSLILLDDVVGADQTGRLVH